MLNTRTHAAPAATPSPRFDARNRPPATHGAHAAAPTAGTAPGTGAYAAHDFGRIPVSPAPSTPVATGAGVIQRMKVDIPGTGEVETRTLTQLDIEAHLATLDPSLPAHQAAHTALSRVLAARKRKTEAPSAEGWTVEDDTERPVKMARRRAAATERTFLDPGRGVHHQAVATELRKGLEGTGPAPVTNLEGVSTQRYIKASRQAMSSSLAAAGMTMDTVDPAKLPWGAQNKAGKRGAPRQKFKRGDSTISQQRKPSSANVGNLIAAGFGDFGTAPTARGKRFSLDITKSMETDLGFANESAVAAALLELGRTGKGFTADSVPGPVRSKPRLRTSLARANALGHHVMNEEPARFLDRGATKAKAGKPGKTSAERHQPALTGMTWGIQTVQSGDSTMADVLGKDAPRGPTTPKDISNQPQLFETGFEAAFRARQSLAAKSPAVAGLFGTDPVDSKRLAPTRKAIRTDLHRGAGGDSDLENPAGYTTEEFDEDEYP